MEKAKPDESEKYEGLDEIQIARRKALERFYELDVRPKLLEQLKKLDDHIDQNLQSIQQGIIQNFEEMFSGENQAHHKHTKPVGYICYTNLRIDLRAKLRIKQETDYSYNQKREKEDFSHAYSIYVYDKNLYITGANVVGKLDVTWAYQFQMELFQHMKKNFRKYVNKIGPKDAERIVMRTIPYFHRRVAKVMLSAMSEISTLPVFIDLAKEKKLEISTGEYYEPMDMLYKEEERTPREKEILEYLIETLEKNDPDRNIPEIERFGDYKGFDLSNREIKFKDLSFANFRSSNLKESILVSKNLAGTNFTNANLEGANLIGSVLCEANFTGANLRGANLSDSLPYVRRTPEQEMIYGRMLGISFRGADLTGANLRNTDMRKADFTDANLTDADFTDTKIKGRNLTPAQKEEVRKGGGEVV